MTTSSYPLEGIRVVDLGWVIAGPMVGHMLGDMGAEVIRIETRKRIDSLRITPENVARDIEKDPMFHDINRNKLSVTINLSKPEGLALVKKLARMCDVLVENFGPSVLSKLGLAFDELREVNEKLIMVSMPGVGNTGPLSNVRTYNPTLSSLAGLDSLVGYPGDRVLRSAAIDLDPNSAVYAFVATLAALYHRDMTGKGQYIEVPQLETSLASLGSEAVMQYLFTGEVMGIQGNREPNMAPHNMYPCTGDDKWVSIAVSTEDEWKGLCKAMGEPAWTRGSRFADLAQRLDNQEELDRQIAAWTSKLTTSEAVTILQEHGVAAAPVADIIERMFDPHYQARGLYYQAEHPVTGLDWLVNSPWLLSETPPRFFRPSPTMGEHNGYVLGGLLGLDPSAIERLVEAEVIY